MELHPVRSLSIVVPCFDEELVVGHTYARLCRVLDTMPGLYAELCFVDDGSRDDTFAALTRLAAGDPRVRVVALSRNFGHQAAITAGLDQAFPRADAVLVMDADLETPPELLPRMLDALAAGHDVVMGVRAEERAVGALRRLASRWFYAAFNLLSDVPIEPGAPDFYLLSARARDALAKMPERNRFLRAMVTWIGFPRAYLPYSPGTRPAGQSKYTFRRMRRLASDALFAFSSAPVKIAMLVGALLACLGAGFAIWLLGGWLGGQAPSTAALIGTGFALASGLQLLAVGAVGSYVVRGLDESRARPLYLVRQVIEGRAADARLLEAVPAADARLVELPRGPRRSSSR
jgi:polyisoprenyl-phosphate glycosyltransferase